MKALVFNKKQQPQKLQVKDVERPLPGANEVLVKIYSASVNAADYRSMKLGMIPKKKIFGSAISGTVEAVGDTISQFKPGDEVLGDLADCGFGGFAEYAVAPENALAIKPPDTSFDDAAALPVAATTALAALREKGQVQKGNKVLIVGSSGSVGIFALQLAKYYDTQVTAVCSTNNVEYAQRAGADHVIDYKKDDFTRNSAQFDLVVAINGNYPLLGYRRILNPGGICVMVGGKLIQLFKSMLFGWLFSLKGKKMKILSGKANTKDLEVVAQLLANGHLKPFIEQRFPFEAAAEAMNYVGQGHARGKVIVSIHAPEE